MSIKTNLNTNMKLLQLYILTEPETVHTVKTV